MEQIKIKETEIVSPVDKVIGDLINFSGRFIDGPKSGKSKIISIKQDMLYLGEERYLDNSPEAIWAHLENGRSVLLGFMYESGRFEISKRYLKLNAHDTI